MKAQWFQQQLIELKPGELPNNVLPVDVFPEFFGLDAAAKADQAIFKLTDATIHTNSTAGESNISSIRACQRHCNLSRALRITENSSRQAQCQLGFLNLHWMPLLCNPKGVQTTAWVLVVCRPF